MRATCAVLSLLLSVPAAAGDLTVERVLGPEVPNRYKHPAAVTELDNGDLIIAYHGGAGEYAEDTAVYATRLKAGATRWDSPRVIADTPFHGDGNPVIWQGPDRLVWLFYVVRYGKTWSDSRIQCKVSRDGAQTWSDSFVLAFEPGMMVRNRPIVLESGDYLLPVYQEKGNDPEFVGAESVSLFIRYDRQTKEWTKSKPITSRIGNIQPAVAEVAKDHLVAYCRRGGGYDGRKDGFMVYSESRDGGRTWAPGVDSKFPNPNAAVDLLKLRNGHLLLIYNDSQTSRTPVTVALSTDGGKTFPHKRNVVEGPGDFAYPYAVQTKDDRVHLIFTSQRRTVINRATFDEAWVTATPAAPAGPKHVGNERNPQAVREVLAGTRTEANAAWWGFDEHDSTDAIQSAIKSGAKRVVVPNMEKDWVVRPLTLASNQELILEDGAVLTAKRGEYRGGGDSVLNANDVSNLTIRGYGATVRMQKEDYIVGKVLADLGWKRWFGPYVKAEWRMALSIRGSTDVRVLGVTLRDSGGDGIFVAGGGKQNYSKNVVIRDVTCDNHYRQGISVISVDGLLVENCTFRNTWGTPPCSGVDIEPDDPKEKVKNIVFRDCRFDDNYGDGIEVFLAHQTRASDPASILFERCHVKTQRGTGIRVAKLYDDGPKGSIEFRDCTVEGGAGYGIKVHDKSADAAMVRFVRCSVADTANDPGYAGTAVPVWLSNTAVEKVARFGGVEFDRVTVKDRRARPAVVLQNPKANAHIVGAVAVANPHGVKAELGQGVALTVHAEPRHVTVYAAPGRFGGWPANHGIWSWGDEILVGFGAGYHKDLGPTRHAIDRERPEEHLLARSRDGGETWAIENPAATGALIPVGKSLHGVTPAGLAEKEWKDCPGGIDFTHPDFAMTVRMTDTNAGPSRFYTSTDRGRSWRGPFRLPTFGQPGIAARTDYIVNGRHDCTLFLTAAKRDGKEGRPLCARTTDGGKTWNLVSLIGDEPRGYAIMPSTVRLGPSELLTSIRCREGPKSWIETFRSRDDGKSWRADALAVSDTGEGNPPSLIRLRDGRLCLTYGYRAAPFGIRAKLSSDGGKTWGDEIVLRADGGGRDVGYPRSVQRADGKVVTVYYFHDTPLSERYIAATVWEPGPK